jgi:molybdopterin/thiamine biosynthesis adenylyltransferase
MQLPWWQRLPSRLLDEEAALQALREDELSILLSHRWARIDGGEPRLFAQIKVGTRTLDLEVRFPPHYPEGCPSVRPVPHDTRVSTHQFKRSGVLCLELGPDNWHPDHTAADMIRSAWKLVLYERLNDFEPIEIPSRHVPSLAERVSSASGVLLRSSDFDARLSASTENADLEAMWVGPHLAQVLPLSFPKDSPLSTPPGMLKGGHRVPGRLVRLEEGAPAPWEVADDAAAFTVLVETFGKTTLGEDLSVVLLRWSDGETRGYLRSKSTLIKLESMPFETADITRIPSVLHDQISKLKIGVVGLGSLGSKVAVSLARVGVRGFVLVDGDVMQGENVCRHQGTFCDVGVMKVDVAKQLIKNVCSAEPEVKTYAVHLGAATNPEYHAKMLEGLASCDLLVDATASPDAFSLMAGLASDHGRALVWGEVFGGGLGGLVGSAHPDHGPCPRCVRAGFLAAASSWPPAPYSRPSVAYGADEDPALVATDADVSLLAAALTNRINDLVVREESVLPSVLVIGLRRGWIFDAPMQTIPIRVRSDDWSCDRCWRSAAEPDPAATASVEKLLAPHADAHDPSHA